MEFGIRNEFSPLKTLLLHRPAIDDLKWITNDSLAYYNFEKPVDPEKFLIEYDLMVKAFQDQGVEIVFLTDVLKDNEEALNYISRRPNLVYMRDMATVYKTGAVIMNPFLKGRQWDGWVVEECFKKLGIPVLGKIEYPGYLEGGGNGYVTTDVGIVSICDRANEDAIKQLASFVFPDVLKELVVINLPQGNIHYDGLFMTIDEYTAFAYKKELEASPTKVLYPDRSERYVWFLDYLAEKGMQVIDSPPHQDLNFVNYAPRRLIGYSGFTANIMDVKERGGDVIGIQNSELIKGNGGVHCMTCPILRD